MKAVDLFCGAGGLTRGLIDAGIEVVAGIDNDESLRKTYEWNNPPARFIVSDIRRMDHKSLSSLFAGVTRSQTMLAGCAPCQTFSKQRRDRPRRHPDATLLGAFGRLVEAYGPGWVLIENVPELASVPGFSTFRRFWRTLEQMGYRVAQGVLNACDFGVPQHRRRYVLIASKLRAPRLPHPLCGNPEVSYPTVRESIAHYPPIKAGENHRGIPNHVASPLSEVNLRRLRATPADGGDRFAWPEDLELECHRNRKRNSFSDVYGRMWWDRVAPTLTGKCNSISNGRFGHPTQDRAISLREAASLQSFPDDYVFFGFKSHIAQHIGNAVPPRLAKALGKAILSTNGRVQARCRISV